jgi:hypothetical protein
MPQSDLEAAFALAWRLYAPDAPTPVEQCRFAAEYVGTGPGVRKRLRDAGLQDWRFDFAWKPMGHLGYFGRGGVAVECDGGIWTQGRHTRGSGYEGDVRKCNAGTRLGWKIYHVTASMLRDDPAGVVAMVREALES